MSGGTKMRRRICQFTDKLIVGVLCTILGILLLKVIQRREHDFSIFFLIQIFVNGIVVSWWILGSKELEYPHVSVRPLYWMINTLYYVSILYINHATLLQSFQNVRIAYIPVGIYMYGVYFVIYVIVMMLFYFLCFSKVKRAKLTTGGVELEIDELPFVTVQNKAINDLQVVIKNSTDMNMSMEYEISDIAIRIYYDNEFTMKDLLGWLRLMTNRIFHEVKVKCDYKTLLDIGEVKDEYMLNHHQYKTIIDQITHYNGECYVFDQQKLVFVIYRLDCIKQTELPKDIIIAVLDFSGSDLSMPCDDYGTILYNNLKVFEYSLVLSIEAMKAKKKGGDRRES